jgi:hypothetical protein
LNVAIKAGVKKFHGNGIFNLHTHHLQINLGSLELVYPHEFDAKILHSIGIQLGGTSQKNVWMI